MNMQSTPKSPGEAQPPRLLLPGRPTWDMACKNVKTSKQDGGLPHMTLFARYGNGTTSIMECPDKMCRDMRPEAGSVELAAL